MEKENSIKSLRTRDSFVEQELCKFLDKTVYKHHYFKDVHRISTKEKQIKGIDIQFSIPCINLYQIKVDEKAQLKKQYIGKPLNTFSLELSFLDKNGYQRLGWFLDERKETQFYFFIWILKADNNDYMKEDDINDIAFCLVERKKIFNYLQQNGYSKQILQEKNQQIRKANKSGQIEKDSKPFYFVYSTQLAEKPINLVMNKNIYYQLSDFYGVVVKDKINKVYHIQKEITDSFM